MFKYFHCTASRGSVQSRWILDWCKFVETVKILRTKHIIKTRNQVKILSIEGYPEPHIAKILQI